MTCFLTGNCELVLSIGVNWPFISTCTAGVFCWLINAAFCPSKSFLPYESIFLTGVSVSIELTGPFPIAIPALGFSGLICIDDCSFSHIFLHPRTQSVPSTHAVDATQWSMQIKSISLKPSPGPTGTASGNLDFEFEASGDGIGIFLSFG